VIDLRATLLASPVLHQTNMFGTMAIWNRVHPARADQRLLLSNKWRYLIKRPFRPRTHWIVWLTLVVIAIAALLSFEQGAITRYFK
jgi:hypothetical protein